MERVPDEKRAYEQWDTESLVERIKRLEDELRRHSIPVPASAIADDIISSRTDVTSQPAPPPPPPPPPPAIVDADAGRRKNKNQKQKKNKGQPQKGRGKFDPTKYSTRLVALKLAYLGKNYNGFEHQATAAVPSIESELWRALVKSCLIFPDRPDEVDFAPWEYSKCGRTDRGVSAFGQVVALRVRSNRAVTATSKGEKKQRETNPELAGGLEPELETAETEANQDDQEKNAKPAWDPIADEIPYCRVLNRLLPPDIRVMAWCPEPPPGFSARFSCRERQYRYFFTQPAFTPLPSSLAGTASAGKGAVRDGWLDVDAMREAAKLFEGLHDFRNFCKIDPAKQITSFTRRVFESDIVEVDDVASALPYLSGPDFRPDTLPAGATYPKVYYFHVRGSAFLWHQIRCMVAVLFAVGQGLESPSIVTELLDVQRQPKRPSYVLASEVPLVLWDCIFPRLDTPGEPDPHTPDALVNTQLQDSIDWVWVGEDDPQGLHGSWGLVDHLWEHWRGKKMDELLANRLLDWVSSRADSGRRQLPPPSSKQPAGRRVFEGGNAARYAGKYVPILEKPVLPSPQEANDKWAQSKGFASAEELTRDKNWRNRLRAAKNAAAAVNGVDDPVE